MIASFYLVFYFNKVQKIIKIIYLVAFVVVSVRVFLVEVEIFGFVLKSFDNRAFCFLLENLKNLLEFLPAKCWSKTLTDILIVISFSCQCVLEN